MNPVLLKPSSDTGAQIIVQGKVTTTLDAHGYHAYKCVAKKAVMASYARLAAKYDVLIVEGAGSPAEINLRDNDIANMGFAETVDCPVWLVADIDRGGVFAHFVGTLALLSASERARIQGFVINRFRGDLALLQPGLDWLERETGKPVLGVLPYLHGLHLEAEDTIVQTNHTGIGERLRVAVLTLPRISNHPAFDPLRLHPQVELRFVGPNEAIPAADLIILPGTKSTCSDLSWLRAQGWDQGIARHLRYGGKLIGLCGGFQMLGRAVHDPLRLEGESGSSHGLGWLDMETILEPEKQLHRVHGVLALDNAPVHGYEIHMGISRGPALERPAVNFTDRSDGAISADGQIFGTYLHGLFESPAACAALLAWAGLQQPEALDYAAIREVNIERLADAIEAHIDLRLLEESLGFKTEMRCQTAPR